VVSEASRFLALAFGLHGISQMKANRKLFYEVHGQALLVLKSPNQNL
jgi:hypothetical protein